MHRIVALAQQHEVQPGSVAEVEAEIVTISIQREKSLALDLAAEDAIDQGIELVRGVEVLLYEEIGEIAVEVETEIGGGTGAVIEVVTEIVSGEGRGVGVAAGVEIAGGLRGGIKQWQALLLSVSLVHWSRLRLFIVDYIINNNCTSLKHFRLESTWFCSRILIP